MTGTTRRHAYGWRPVDPSPILEEVMLVNTVRVADDYF